jgi:hypothetical protein
MVEDRITDGKRIAELLASELSGLDTGSLEQVAIVDAERSATPSETGTQAYRLTYRGDALARVLIYPDHAEVDLEAEPTWPDDQAVSTLDDEKDTLVVDSGAATKDAVDAIRRAISSLDGQ